MIAVIIEFDVREECRDEFLARLREDARETLNDDGCLRMEVLLPQDRGAGVLLSELWRDRQAIDNHRLKPGHSHDWQLPLISGKRVTSCDVLAD